MPTVTGRAGIDGYFALLRSKFEQSILPGAARAGAEVIADEARRNVRSAEVRERVIKTYKRRGDLITVTVTVKPGFYYSVGVWLEWGTSAHIIRDGDEAREGRTVRRMNLQEKRGELVINGKFAGSVVRHPGAREQPWLRPALDTQRDAALRVAQGYINRRVAKIRAAGTIIDGDDE